MINQLNIKDKVEGWKTIHTWRLIRKIAARKRTILENVGRIDR